ncbi:autotransporter [Variovorax sp. HJSM1_2]|uniref:autotransporter n=1 Tax=Variovorax sp. HJSM1_2 TaxID=3366263 RepID=UPI003BCE7916
MKKTLQTLRFFRVVCAATGLAAAAAAGSIAIAATASGANASSSAATASIGGEAPWPRSLALGNTTLTIYAPQLDAWDGISLNARLAVQVQVGKEKPSTHFGILTLDARTLVDKGTRVVTIDQAVIQRADFPSVSAADAKRWADAIAADMNGKSRSIALDRLEAQMAISGAVKAGERHPLRNEPPRFVFSRSPALLVSIDGAPVYRALQGLPYERVINTRPLVLRDSTGTHYLKVFDGWMQATTLAGPWTVLENPATSLAAAFKQSSDAHLIDPLTGQIAADKAAPSLKQLVPVVYTTSTPTELLVTEGEPRYVPIAGTELLYVENTTGRIFKSIKENQTYILVSGRWFKAPNEQGPWQFVAANTLPADFAKIPDDSAVENVLASVAGTPQAREAAVAVTVPQTAAVKIEGTQLTPPRFDGEPMLQSIAGTSLEYVANTATPIIRVGASGFYALQNGVWFTAAAVRGPWVVATSVPAAIYTIPPSSALYYVTFVTIYSVHNGTVYVGFTPGYQGTYIDPLTGVVVYGTGYVYDPWTGAVWYGASPTYGYAAAVTYTPWSGWAVGFGFGWFWGAATVAWGWGWGPYPYWGPWAYPAWGVAWGSGGGAVAWGPGGWAGYSGNIYSQWGNRASVTRVGGGFNAWTGNEWAGQVGASYNSRTGIASAGQRGAVGNIYSGNYAAGARGGAVGPGGSAIVGERGTVGNAFNGNQVSGSRGAFYNQNTGEVTRFGGATGADGGHVGHVGDDVYAGKDGNVYRNTGEGWQKFTPDGGWQGVPGAAQGQATREATGGLGSSPQQPAHLDQDRSARQMGDERAEGLRNSSRGMNHTFGGGGGGFHGGGFHGGGFRRR